MIRTIIESPYGTRIDGTRCTDEEIAFNIRYAHKCLLDSLNRNEAPFLSHIFYTLVLNDSNTDERKRGMEAGFAWGNVAQQVAVYTDYGITSGMEIGINRHMENGLRIVYRTIFE